MTVDFSEATWEYYSETLGRSVIPDEATFTRYVLYPELLIDDLYVDSLIAQKEDGGFVNAACMMAEEEYVASLAESSGGATLASESLGDYSYSVNTPGEEGFVDSTSKRKCYQWLRMYCWLFTGVC